LQKRSCCKKNWHVDYLEVKTQEKLTQPNLDDKALIILAAAYFDKIRLIDNIEFCIE
jgi:pantoate--beta-alanine ligase